jgi:23S rRNA (pseudouridine1915-N3)-methyltransferase
MKIVLLSVGKTDNSHFAELIEAYVKRVNFYIPCEMVIVPDPKNRKSFSEGEQKIAESNLLIKTLQTSDYVVLLDDKGKQHTSTEFAKYIEKKTHAVPKRLVFVIGGPYGFSQEMYNVANEKISLSKMTFTHQMVRLIFIEQLLFYVTSFYDCLLYVA